MFKWIESIKVMIMILLLIEDQRFTVQVEFQNKVINMRKLKDKEGLRGKQSILKVIENL